MGTGSQFLRIAIRNQHRIRVAWIEPYYGGGGPEPGEPDLPQRDNTCQPDPAVPKTGRRRIESRDPKEAPSGLTTS